jgi:hypothetical protein
MLSIVNRLKIFNLWSKRLYSQPTWSKSHRFLDSSRIVVKPTVLYVSPRVNDDKILQTLLPLSGDSEASKVWQNTRPAGPAEKFGPERGDGERCHCGWCARCGYAPSKVLENQ